MKQNLNIGNVVDDSTGDYLREGGIKLNSNFDDLYYQLGDGSNPHAAGAWKTISVVKDTNNFTAEFGHAYAVDTSTAQMKIQLPKGSVDRYNTVIRFRDVFGTWQTNPVTIVPASGDTMKGDSGSKVFSRTFTDLEMVYCYPGRWEYVATKQINKISSDSQASVLKKEYIATAGQTDFTDIFKDNDYNSQNIEIYRRGNLLYYGDTFTSESDFGSIGTGNSIVALDGKTIRLREACQAGDAVIIVTYLDGLSQWRSTYNRLDVKILDESKTNLKTSVGSTIVANLDELSEITVEQMGYTVTSNSGLINVNTFEVYVNGVFLNEAGTAGLPMFRCIGADALDQASCDALGGEWSISSTDYRVTNSEKTGAIESIIFDRKFEDGDIISIKWYNNDIGTTLELDDILDATDQKYIASSLLSIDGTVRVTDYNNPVWPNVEIETKKEVDVSSIYNFFDVLYPIGSIYENGINPNNPGSYMGIGSWVLFGEKQVSVGWTKDTSDNLFHYNNNDLDSSGDASAKAGGTGGARIYTLTNDNLPKTQTDEKVLISDANGAVVIGGCTFDPDSEGPAYDKFRESQAITNEGNVPPVAIDTMPPYITVYRWMRVA